MQIYKKGKSKKRNQERPASVRGDLHAFTLGIRPAQKGSSGRRNESKLKWYRGRGKKVMLVLESIRKKTRAKIPRRITTDKSCHSAKGLDLVARPNGNRGEKHRWGHVGKGQGGSVPDSAVRDSKHTSRHPEKNGLAAWESRTRLRRLETKQKNQRRGDKPPSLREETGAAWSNMARGITPTK